MSHVITPPLFVNNKVALTFRSVKLHNATTLLRGYISLFLVIVKVVIAVNTDKWFLIRIFEKDYVISPIYYCEVCDSSVLFSVLFSSNLFTSYYFLIRISVLQAFI